MDLPASAQSGWWQEWLYPEILDKNVRETGRRRGEAETVSLCLHSRGVALAEKATGYTQYIPLSEHNSICNCRHLGMKVRGDSSWEYTPWGCVRPLSLQLIPREQGRSCTCTQGNELLWLLHPVCWQGGHYMKAQHPCLASLALNLTLIGTYIAIHGCSLVLIDAVFCNTSMS